MTLHSSFSKIILLLLVALIWSCKDRESENIDVAEISEPIKESVAALKEKLTNEGYQIFDYVDPDSGDTVIMQQYYIAFLKSGPNRNQTQTEADSLQTLHMEHLGKMYAMGMPISQDLLVMMVKLEGLLSIMCLRFKWQTASLIQILW